MYLDTSSKSPLDQNQRLERDVIKKNLGNAL